MYLYLVHHADAVGAEVDPQRPLSVRGRAQAEWLADQAKAADCAPAAIWHSGKLRARQTAEAFLRACSPFAEFVMVRGLRPDDPPDIIRDALRAETRDILAVGHMPHLSALLELLVKTSATFPQHGLVALENSDGAAWTEAWRASCRI